MSILKVAQLGHPVLRAVAAPVEHFDHSLATLAGDMLETMIEYRGVGLAAPQVREPLRLFVAQLDEPEPLVIVNPQLEVVGDQGAAIYEGCLSITGFRGLVPRAAQVILRGQDLSGGKITRQLEGFAAIVAQHEYDHLEGIVYLDRMDLRNLLSLEEYERMLAEQAAQAARDRSSRPARESNSLRQLPPAGLRARTAWEGLTTGSRREGW